MLKQYTVTAIAILVATVVVLFMLLDKQSDKAKRWEDNYKQELLRNNLIRLTTKEMKEQKDSTIQMLMDSLEIRPKEVVRYRTIKQTFIDTVPKEVKVPIPVIDTFVDTSRFIAPYGVYDFYFEEPCYSIHGYVQLDEDMDVGVDEVKFSSNHSEIVYKKRKHNIWFIHFGRWIYRREVVGDCGTYESKEIEVIKE